MFAPGEPGWPQEAIAPSMDDVQRHRCPADALASNAQSPPFVWTGAPPAVRLMLVPVCREEAIELGMPATVCSCLLEVDVDEELRSRVLALIPADAKSYPRLTLQRSWWAG